MASDEGELDMETFQRLSDSYQPDVQGPLIRDRLPILALMSEYNNADPTYVTKTAALAATYCEYRPVKGDGQCGWRAVVFGYFESLMSQDVAKVASEKARIHSFNDTLVAVGYEFTMVELFVDETMELFDSVHQAMQSGDTTDRLLLDTFNDETRSNSIVFHFKLLTSATMKLNPDQYQPYLEQPLFDYCQSNVDAVGREIEQISLQALTDGVIAPAQINIIVMYLDRSEGGEVTPHHLVAVADPSWPAITLLYRPGHYDMIYQATPIKASRFEFGMLQDQFIPTGGFGPPLSNVRVLSQFNENQSIMQPYSGENYPASSYNNIMPYMSSAAPFMAPNLTTPHSGPAATALTSSNPSFDTSYATSDGSVGTYDVATSGFESVRNDNARHSISDTLFSPTPNIHPPMLLPSYLYSSPPAASPVSPLSPGPSPGNHELKIRMSQPCYEMLGQRHHEILPLETGPFKNSPFNRGHFANPDFQPVMWNAAEDYA